jgi:uncharacterized protein YdiU (UPF0061 family)
MGRIHRRLLQTKVATKTDSPYRSFDQLSGWHSWQDVVPESCVMYQARKLPGCKLLYFNFELAIEMGLIPKNHPNTMTPLLESKILDTFAVRIINEYDKIQNVRFLPNQLKPNKFMATRYLQLQHANKTGATSGDGRAIWNGQLTHNGTTWDVSSRGTGVTSLAPGAVLANKPVKTGSTKYGYGCGLADIDELVGSAIMAEIFHNQEICTERMLAIIDIQDGRSNGIGVRAAKNLFRPAHLFTHLKQGRIEPLKKAVDYVIKRQIDNRTWKKNLTSISKYAFFLNQMTKSFAKFAARLDREYIFAWLDWDGDNVLLDGGIIDYGSIRQFGLRHDEYRYDDVDRFSTTLAQQKGKAREIVQNFAQIVDFIQTGNKKPIQSFANHNCLKEYDKYFETYLHEYFLKQLGLDNIQVSQLMTKKLSLVKKIYAAFSSLERVKTKSPAKKVSDGINRPAILNMRNALIQLPYFLSLNKNNGAPLEILPTEIFFNLIIADSAAKYDRKPTAKLINDIITFQKHYIHLIAEIASGNRTDTLLQSISNRAQTHNRPDRLTGDGLLYVVDEVMALAKKPTSKKAVQAAIDTIIARQSPMKKKRAPKNSKFISTVATLVDLNKESI